jgi:hypothetical protein
MDFNRASNSPSWGVAVEALYVEDEVTRLRMLLSARIVRQVNFQNNNMFLYNST